MLVLIAKVVKCIFHKKNCSMDESSQSLRENIIADLEKRVGYIHNKLSVRFFIAGKNQLMTTTTTVNTCGKVLFVQMSTFRK